MSGDALEPPYGARDPGGMAARLAGQPEQIGLAIARAGRDPWRFPADQRAARLVAVGAMGGSAIATDLTAGLYHDRLPRPLMVVRDYRWPAWVTSESLAVLASYSGNTEETLALYREAGERGVPRAAITCGGTLGEWCTRDGVPWARLPSGFPPRAALFASWVALTSLLDALGWVDDPVPGWTETMGVLEARDQTAIGFGTPEASNPAKQLARALAGRAVFLYASGPSTAPVATRWRQQINENAKMLGHSAVVPELNHNEIVGWERGTGGPGAAAVVLLRDAEDAPAISARMALTGEWVGRSGAAVHEVTSVGQGRIARLASLVQFGDYLSFYLALLNGVDPTPVASIDEFKRRLAEAAGRAG